MKQHVSRGLRAIAVAYLGFAPLYVLGVAVVFNVPAADCIRLLLNPFFYAVTALAMAAGYGLWEVRRWGWYVFLLANALIVYLNAWVANGMSESNHRVAAFALSLLAVIGAVARVAREIRVPWFFPRIRWWEVNPRYRLAAPATLRRAPAEGAPESEPLGGEILDLSVGGCFLKLQVAPETGERVTVVFKLFGRELALAGVVVWQTRSTVTHPRGVGVKFTELDRAGKRALRLVTRRLREVERLYRGAGACLDGEEFRRRLEEIEVGLPRGDSRRRTIGADLRALGGASDEADGTTGSRDAG